VLPGALTWQLLCAKLKIVVGSGDPTTRDTGNSTKPVIARSPQDDVAICQYFGTVSGDPTARNEPVFYVLPGALTWQLLCAKLKIVVGYGEAMTKDKFPKKLKTLI